MKWINQVICGDNLEVLGELPEDSVDCVVTSPPSYKPIESLCQIFEACKRPLKPEGTLWINLKDRHNEDQSMDGFPFRFAITMIDRGFVLRNTLIWHKSDILPDDELPFSVDFEYLFFFSQQQRYYFEQQFDSLISKPHSPGRKRITDGVKRDNPGHPDQDQDRIWGDERGKNKRAVWKTATFEELVETPIKAGCPKSGTVLDPFFGHGSVGAETLRQGKRFIGIDISSECSK